MTKAEVREYMYENNVRGDLSIESMAEDIGTPQGEWIDIGGYEVCKNCHEVKRFPHWNYCPNCGAYMKGVDDEV